MQKKKQHGKIILGLKIRKARIERQLSFADFSKITGLSVSYLNEIEKGKKFPKQDKIEIIADALQTDVDALTSRELPRSLAVVDDLLQSNFLNELPLDIIGLDLSNVIKMIADAPTKVGAFVATLLELSRNYALVEENFYFGTLRAYLEMNNNYFKDLEEEVQHFIDEFFLPTGMPVPTNTLKRILEETYGYEIKEDGLKNYPELTHVRAVFVPQKKQLLLNCRLTTTQIAFQLGKELGFNTLNLKHRALTSSLLRVNSFEEVLSHFKAGYFSAALLIHKDSFAEDLKQFLKHPHWEESWLKNLLQKYQAAPETLFQRITNLLPEIFDINNLFFLRTILTPSDKKFRINRELHLGKKHPPHSNGLNEHYCRRWLAYSLSKDLQHPNQVKIGIQNGIFQNDKTYLCLTVTTKTGDDKIIGLTIGILKDKHTNKIIKFAADPNIPTVQVNTTCERCPIRNCSSRAAEPTIIEKKEQFKSMMKTIEKISK